MKSLLLGGNVFLSFKLLMVEFVQPLCVLLAFASMWFFVMF